MIGRDVSCFVIERGGKSKQQADVRALKKLIRAMGPSNAVIEKVGAMLKQGVSGTFAFGRTMGQIEGIGSASR